MTNITEKIISDLPMIDTVVSKLLVMLNDENTTSNHLEKIIKEDPILSLKIVKLANSTFFSPVKPITSIAHSVRFIGFKSLKSLLYSIALQAIGKNKNNDKHIKDLQKKCIVNAIVALMIGKEFLKKNRSPFMPEDFYTFGLFHDIGILIIANYDLKNLYMPIYEKVQNGETITDAETDLHHTYIGEKLLSKWEIPEEFRKFVLMHHDINLVLDDKHFEAPYKILQIAEIFSEQLGYDFFTEKSLSAKEELVKLNIDVDKFYDEDGKISFVKDFVDNMISGFII